jgi:hydrogenase-1 operon protein HyaE
MSTVLESLAERADVNVLRTAEVDAFVSAPGPAVLFFAGDGRRRDEAHDVAVVLRELLGQGPAPFRLGLVDQRDEERLRARYDVIVVPQLVLFRDGERVDRIPRIQDWAVYAARFGELTASPTATPTANPMENRP